MVLEGGSAVARRRTMYEAIKTEHPHIVQIAGVCGGEPVIDALRVGVRHVVTLHQRGEAIVDIAEVLGITFESHVHRSAALASFKALRQFDARLSRRGSANGYLVALEYHLQAVSNNRS